MNRLRLLKLPRPQRLGQLDHLRHRIRFQQVLVVEVVEEDVETLFCVVDLGFEGGGGAGFDTLHICVEVLVDWLSSRENVGAVTWS